ncbi:hypothetical protein BDZ91DRAFT_660402 [Kalaharituber pfeilii]|nr:hypothetical protein BDZ91DRAFT_660402 [Kalaharituber pfeilii]
MYALLKSIIVLTFLLSSVLAYALPSGKIVERQVISYGGSGCPAGTVNVILQYDPQGQNNVQEVKIIFDAYVAFIGPQIPITESHKSCAISVHIPHPPGRCAAVYQAYYEGGVQLDWKVKATQRSAFWWAGATAGFLSVWIGIQPATSYTITDSVPKEVWSPPNGNNILNIRTETKLDNKDNLNGSGSMTSNSITNNVTHIYYFKWKDC